MAEAILMLPSLLLIWSSIVFFARTYDKATILSTTLREHAWAHAIDGCQGSVGADTILGGGPGAPMADTLTPLATSLPIIGSRWPGLWPEEHSYSRYDSQERERMLQFDGPDAQISKEVTLVCNEVRKGTYIDEFTWAAWGIWGY
jgi:hypothetical protein